MQLPSAPGRLQARHASAQALAQQTASTQWALAHSLSTVQLAPSPFSPQLPPSQNAPGTQWSSFSQKVRQALPAQRYGAHASGELATQVPLPSHADGGVKRLLEVSQSGSLQTVPAGHFRQPPFPSQRPSKPQLEAALAGQPACPARGLSPSPSGRQVPALPVWSQATQAPRQAESQQTPSAQWPEAQASPDGHGAPIGRLASQPSRSRRWSGRAGRSRAMRSGRPASGGGARGSSKPSRAQLASSRSTRRIGARRGKIVKHPIKIPR